MKRFDVFNGDADGICALHQLRLAEPAKATLVTGVKRDVGLLAGLGKVRGAQVTVLDLPFHENREAALGLLERDCRLLYFDHHFAGEVPSHPALESHIHPSPSTCTSLLVDDYLKGAFRVRPGSARAVRLAGSTCMPFMADRSMTNPPSQTALPAIL